MYYEYRVRFRHLQEVINKKSVRDWLIFEFSNREWNEIINTEGNWNECNKILSSMDMDQISEISITYDEKQIKEYWKELAEKYDTVNIQRKSTTILVNEITLKESDYVNQI